ncbi:MULTISPECIES: LysE family translocator [Thiorhodovibrio]|uniref:LysE family translocator n=1 Tax=Thiorhodovibrio TaxID=61593 RepID=UPI001F5C6C47|nr:MULTISPECIES: LysE family transporter [Thiorhodovibrio]
MGGLSQGIAVTCGIVLGDLLFVATALFGLAALAERLGGLFVLIKVLGGLYLLWLGGTLLLSRSTRDSVNPSLVTQSGLLRSLLAGLVLTLGDLKAILFYASIFPLVMPTDQLAAADVVAVMAVTITSVGGVKLLYAFSARKLATMVQDRRMRRIGQRGAGVLLLGAGGSLIVSTAG